MNHLYDLKAPAIIIPDDNGEEYCNQVGGVSCLQRSAKGRLVLCKYTSTDIPNLFQPAFWYNHGSMSSATNRAEAIQAFFDGRISIYGPTKIEVIYIDCECEAWANITIRENGQIKDAVMTWPNSD